MVVTLVEVVITLLRRGANGYYIALQDSDWLLHCPEWLLHCFEVEEGSACQEVVVITLP